MRILSLVGLAIGGGLALGLAAAFVVLVIRQF
jgi:hypothetical protein